MSPEHLARAYDPEVEHWSIVSKENELINASPAAGGTGFIDLRGAPLPKGQLDPPLDDVKEENEELMDDDGGGGLLPEEDVPECPPPGPEELSSSSTSMARMHLESEREQKRTLKSSAFFDKKARSRRMERAERLKQHTEAMERAAARPEDVAIPEDDEFDPEKHDYHQARPPSSTATRKLSPLGGGGPEDEAAEREAKRLRVEEPKEKAISCATTSAWPSWSPRFPISLKSKPWPPSSSMTSSSSRTTSQPSSSSLASNGTTS